MKITNILEAGTQQPEVSAAEVKQALRIRATHIPELAPLLDTAERLIVRLETEKREALLALQLSHRKEAENLLRRQASVAAPKPANTKETPQ